MSCTAHWWLSRVLREQNITENSRVVFFLLLLHFSFVVPINSRDILCTAKKAIDKMEGQHPEWEKIFANDTNDKGFIYKIYKKHTQLSTKKNPTEPHLKNGQKTWIDSFSKEVCRWSTDTGKTAQHGTYQGNVNQNHSELSPHTCKNGCYHKVSKQQALVKIQRRWNPCAPLVGMYGINWCSHYGKQCGGSWKN